MLPPDSTATAVAAGGSSSRWYSHAATATAPPGSATSRAWRASRRTAAEHLVLGHGDDVVTSAGCARTAARRPAPPGARRRRVRLASAAGQATRSPRRSELAGVGGEFRLDARPRPRPGSSARTAAAMPGDEPAAADRDEDQVDLGAVGRDLQADRALARDDRPVVERRDRRVPVPGRPAPRSRPPGPPGSARPYQSRRRVLDRVRLDRGRRPRDHHDRPHTEQGRGVGDRLTVVAAGMGHDPVLAGGPLARP